jgi:hypothetical protein
MPTENAKRLRSKSGKTAMLGHPGWLSLRGRRSQAPLISHRGFAAINFSAPGIGTKRPLRGRLVMPFPEVDGISGASIVGCACLMRFCSPERDHGRVCFAGASSVDSV